MTNITKLDYQKMYRDSLEGILRSQDVVTTIKSNLDIMLSIVPEIGPMIGFDHMHPHHHLDVWEHTLLAISNAPEDEFDTRLALLFHDIGKPHSWSQDNKIRHFYGHAGVSAIITRNVLERLGYEPAYVDEICDIVKHHDDAITRKDIENDRARAIKLFKVQICDSLAHNPEKNQKRLKYIEDITCMLNDVEYLPNELPPEEKYHD